MTKEEIKQFITFLKENNAYSAYRHNIKTPNFPKERTNELANLVNKFEGECSQLMDYSFDWVITKEGHTYWGDLYIKWMKVSLGIKKL